MIAGEAWTTVHSSSVVADLDLATKCRDDHAALAVDVRGVSDFLAMADESPEVAHFIANPTPGKQPRYTAESLGDPARTSSFRRMLCGAYDMAAAGHDDRHEACAGLDGAVMDLVDKVHAAAAYCFVPQPAAPRRKWISDATWTCIRHVNGLRSFRRRWLRSLYVHTCRLVLAEWRALVAARCVTAAAASGATVTCGPPRRRSGSSAGLAASPLQGSLASKTPHADWPFS